MECAESDAAIWVTWGERSVFTGVVKRADGRKILLDDPRGELDSAGRVLSEDEYKKLYKELEMAQGKRKPVKVLARYYADMTKPRNAVKHRLAPVERGSPRVERTPEGVLDAEIAPGDEVKIVIVANWNAYERYWALVLKVQGERLWTLTRSSLQLVPREFASEPIIVKKANVIAVHKH